MIFSRALRLVVINVTLLIVQAIAAAQQPAKSTESARPTGVVRAALAVKPDRETALTLRGFALGQSCEQALKVARQLEALEGLRIAQGKTPACEKDPVGDGYTSLALGRIVEGKFKDAISVHANTNGRIAKVHSITVWWGTADTPSARAGQLHADVIAKYGPPRAEGTYRAPYNDGEQHAMLFGDSGVGLENGLSERLESEHDYKTLWQAIQYSRVGVRIHSFKHERTGADSVMLDIEAEDPSLWIQPAAQRIKL